MEIASYESLIAIILLKITEINLNNFAKFLDLMEPIY